jgi:NADH-quinone oxidoreductase subunit B
MAPVLRQIYDQMADPKWVLSMGVCASSGGMFNNYAIVQGVDHVVPVDMYLPGCPPRPEMLIDAILKLREKILHEPLGDNGRKMLEQRKAQGDVPVVAPGAMPSSYRSDSDRRRQWEKAVREGREEQLRIENWMRDGRHLQGGGRW